MSASYRDLIFPALPPLELFARVPKYGTVAYGSSRGRLSTPAAPPIGGGLSVLGGLTVVRRPVEGGADGRKARHPRGRAHRPRGSAPDQREPRNDARSRRAHRGARDPGVR